MESKQSFQKSQTHHANSNGSENKSAHIPDANSLAVDDIQKMRNSIQKQLAEIKKQNDEAQNPADIQIQLLQLKKQYSELERQNEQLNNIITQHKNELHNVIEANKNYVSVLAHDLKSPLSNIYGALGILKDNIRKGRYNELIDFIDIASSSALKTTHLIENILVWVHSQTSNKQFNPIRIHLGKVVNQEIENNFLALKLKKISLIHRIPENLYVLADLQMLRSIIRNLISNAIKFTMQGGNISIVAAAEKTFIEVRIEDDGIGISQQQQKELFSEHSSDVRSVYKNGKVRGLGLIICKEFIELHGGTILVKSKPDRGSSFIVTLPSVPPEEFSTKSLVKYFFCKKRYNDKSTHHGSRRI
jgi:signal transduction histidine kinase